jgi:hypothetical protein
MRSIAGAAALRAHWLLAAALMARPVWAEDGPLAYRGNVTGVASSFAINNAAAANPNNVLALPGDYEQVQFDMVLNAKRGKWTAQVEGFGKWSHNTADQHLRPYQAWMSLASEDDVWYARVGKAVPSWGVGQIWNPVRSLTNEQRRDLILPSGAVKGVNLAQLQYVVDDESSVSAFAFPAEDQRAGGYALRYSGAHGTFDYALSVYANGDGARRAGTELSWATGTVTWVAEATYANRNEVPLIGPGGKRVPRSAESGISYVIGASVVLPANVTGTWEYYHDATGYSASQNRAFAATLTRNLDLYNPLGNGNDTLYAGLTKQILTNNSAIGTSFFHNIQSRVGLWRVHGETQLFDTARLSVDIDRYLQGGNGPELNFYHFVVRAQLRWSF